MTYISLVLPECSRSSKIRYVSLRPFSTRRNFRRTAQFFFVFFRSVLPESSQTKKNSATELLEESMREAVVRMGGRFGPNTAVCQKDVYAKYNCEKVYVFAKNFASM